MKKGRFVIHEHHARNLHFDLRLEIGGVLRSWAVPKGPSMNPAEKRLAVEVPDHSVGYIDFEGNISEGSYGAGRVVIWDNGSFETNADPERALANGRLTFRLFGRKLEGEFTLVKMSRQNKGWLLIKADDSSADYGWKLRTVLEPRPATPANRDKSRR